MTPVCAAVLLAIPAPAFSMTVSSAALSPARQPQDPYQSAAARLKDTDPLARRQGVIALGALNDPKAVPILIEALRDAHPFVREAAASSLGVFGVAAALNLAGLLDPAKEKTPAVRRAAAAALAHAGDAGKAGASLALTKALKDPDPGVRYAALRSLNVLRPPNLSSILQELRRDPDASMRRTAVGAIAQARDPSSLEALGDSLADKNPDVRLEAVRGLSGCDDPQARAALEIAIKDVDWRVRLEAVLALAAKGELKEALAVVDKALAAEIEPAAKSALTGARKRLRARLGIVEAKPTPKSAPKPTVKTRPAAKGKRP